MATQATDSGPSGTSYAFTAPADVWTNFIVPLSDLGSLAAIARINLQEASGATQATFYLDELRLIGADGNTLFLGARVDRHTLARLGYF